MGEVIGSGTFGGKLGLITEIEDVKLENK